MSRALELRGLTKSYGMLKAVDDVSVVIRPGARHALIGPNGAGKSTLFKLITGELAATSGSLHFGDQDVSRWSQPRRSRLGICQTYQHSSVFSGITLEENVALAARRNLGRGADWWRPASRVAGVAAIVEECLETVGLLERSQHTPASLSHGERRQLELAIVLAAKPSVLLLDEPTAGMSATESSAFVRLVRSLPSELSVVIVEHDLDVVFDLAEEISVLNFGTLLASGTRDEIIADERVQEAYLAWMPTDGANDSWTAEEA